MTKKRGSYETLQQLREIFPVVGFEPFMSRDLRARGIDFTRVRDAASCEYIKLIGKGRGNRSIWKIANTKFM